MNKVTITFLPSKKQVKVDQGASIMDVAREVGLHIQSVCGGDGVCGKCRVIIKKGQAESTPTGLLTPEEIKQGLVLACDTTVFNDISVEIPPESRADESAQPDRQGLAGILLTGKGKHKQPTRPGSSGGFDLYSPAEELEPDILHQAKILEHSPLATKIFLKLPPPTLQDTASDLGRIYRALHKKGIDNIQTGLTNLRHLGSFLRENDWAVTVTLGKRHQTMELVQIEPGDTSKTNYGLAVDIGTTTIVTHLVDLVSEETLCSVGAFNKQITYGDDVISRIIFAHEKAGLEKLHQAVVDSINFLIQGCISDVSTRGTKIRLEDITCLVCAGNPTMTHLLLNIDPGHLRKEPYVPVANNLPVIRAAEAGIRINPRGLLACAPSVSSYIGADITAGLLVSDLAEKPDLAMYIDLGTNGEIVLGNKEWLTCCACSIGPAFEGSGIKCGTRAVNGAIQKVKIDPNTKHATVKTIGNGKPNGICGSGLIELISELLKAGIIDKAGKINKSKTQPVQTGPDSLEYLVVPKHQSASGRNIVITQADIDHIIRSKAAVYAGISTLLKKMHYSVKDVSRFYIAGGFGSYLDITKAIGIGLLPNASLDKFHYIGNGSVEGARMILLSYIALNRARQIADQMTYIELSMDNLFTEEFISAMFLPHTDLKLFEK